MKLIIYVHGALSTKRSFAHLVREVPTEKDAVAFFSYDIRQETGADISTRLAYETIKLIKKHRADEIVFVAHSYGGVLAVEAVRRMDDLWKGKGRQVFRIFSMSSPYGGSSIASLLKFFKPSSVFFDNIGKYNAFMRSFSSKALPCEVLGLITTGGEAGWISDPNDGVVSVKSQLHFENDPKWTSAFLNVNHFEVLLAHDTVYALKNFLSASHNS